MKAFSIIFLILILFSNCESESSSSMEGVDFSKVMMPDELGKEVFKAFKSGEVEDLKPLCMTTEDMLDNITKEDIDISVKIKENIKLLSNNDSLRLYANGKIYDVIFDQFITARKKLLSRLRFDIEGYRVSDVYCTFDSQNSRIFGKTILKIKDKYGDVHYLGFQMAEVSKYTWKIYDDIWVPEKVGEEYTKL